MTIKALWFITLFFLAILGAGLWMLEDTTVHRVTIAAGSRSGGAFAMARAIAEVAREHHPSLQVNVVESLGSLQNMDLLERGHIDLATVQADTAMPRSARMVATLYQDVFQLIVRKDPDGEQSIENVQDLHGRRIALPPQGSGQRRSFAFLASHYGLKSSDYEDLAMSSGSANWALIDGAVDAVFRVRACGNRSIMKLIDAVDVGLVPIDQAAAMRHKEPVLETAMIPMGCYQGHPALPGRDLMTVGVPRLLVAAADLDSEVVSLITSVLFERRRELVHRTPLAGFISAPDRTGGTSIPLHPGARKFYDRDRPSFFQENAEPIALVVTVAALMVSGLFQLTARKKRRRVDQYNRAVLTLGVEARTASSHEAVTRLKERLFQVAGSVVDDAETGQISTDGFQFFAFTWGVANGAIDERKAELQDPSRPPGEQRPSTGGAK
jgi:TRAP transporter TAXI family solute receptor